MADFCRQCSIKIFGQDNRDLAGLTSVEDMGNGVASTALCEECGAIQVDPEGNCLGGCSEDHTFDPEGNSEDNEKEKR